jgi:hypothetical protein
MNEWLLIPLTVISFLLIACTILAIVFGTWLGVNWTVARLTRATLLSRLRRSEPGSS